MGISCGIVGLPNVGKSTLFNALSAAGAAVANYPFCTIEPNVGVVPVPDHRLDALVKLYKPKSVVKATVNFVDIAGLVRGASQGRGPGQPVPGQHPRDRRHLPRGPLLRGPEHRPRRGAHRPGGRRPDHRHRAVSEGPGGGRQADRAGQEGAEGPGPQGREADPGAGRAPAQGAGRRDPGARPGAERRGAGADPGHVPADDEEGVLRGQPGRKADRQRRRRPPRAGAARPRREAGLPGGARSARRPRRRSPAWTRPIARRSWRAWG